MRKCLLLTLLFLSLTVIAQQPQLNNALFQINQLPPQGVVLDKGWKFQAGDHPQYAQPDFDDKNWQSIDLNQPAARFLNISKGNTGWLRLHFALGASVQDTLMALLIEQFGASEIYLDGKLVKRLGSITSAKEITAFNPHGKPLPVQLGKESGHILAIRFAPALLASEWVLQRSKVSPLSIWLQPLSDAIANRETMLNKVRFQIGLTYTYAVLGLLFLLLFLFYPRQHLNLFFSLFNVFLILLAFIHISLNEGQYSLNEGVYFSYAIGLVNRLIGINIMLFILYSLYNSIKSFYAWFLISLLVDFVLSLFLPVQYQFISYTLRGAFVLLCLWLTYQALRTKEKEAWLIGLVALSVASINISFVLFELTGLDITAYATLVVPIVINASMITYLALRYTKANRSLERQLVEVKRLSTENLRQEHEKQQILASQKETLEQQVTQRTAELKQSLEELKAAQSQLVQREKMASLGELTAGIAHEIQNPLNFVNNFSEVNKELITELKNEVRSGNSVEAINIADEIEENEDKISHHGKRADAIVKGMLQHSRISTGKKEPTNINALVDEYVRLAYQAARTKDKNFHSELKTHFDPSIGEIVVVPQDIGRVLLNLFNNALYAVCVKQYQMNGAYKPEVTVSTKKENDKVVISVRDNGNGIPQKVLDKIYQPFFTTKPTGEGTGLGLSLSYDIITKGHGGELKVETKEGEYAEFIVQLPS